MDLLTTAIPSLTNVQPGHICRSLFGLVVDPLRLFNFETSTPQYIFTVYVHSITARNYEMATV